MNRLDVSFIGLMYHNVCAQPACGRTWPGLEDLSPSITDYFVDIETFARHCEIIAQSGAAITIDELRATSPMGSAVGGAGRRSRLRPGVLLTFDDGWRGTVEIAGPILASCNLHALLFVTTDLIGHPYFVDCDQLGTLATEFVIGSHARSHRLLSALSDQEVRAELTESKSILEGLIGREVDAIAYPGGSFDQRVLRMTYEVGYRLVFTSHPAVNAFPPVSSCFGRLAVKKDTSAETIERWLRGDLRQERVRAVGLRAAKCVLGRSTYRWLRSRLMSEDASHLEMTDLARGQGGGVGVDIVTQGRSIRRECSGAIGDDGALDPRRRNPSSFCESSR